MFLLDTNVVSELRKIDDGKADAQVSRWQARTEKSGFYISAVTLMELEIGILLLARRDAPQAARLRAWLDTRVIPEFAGRTLPVDRAVALRCARLHVPHRLPERDAFIAATALVHGMTVVTRNTADFAGTGVRLLNPWDPSSSTAPST